MKQRVFSGIQPSGVPTLGNYLGAIRNWIPLQDRHESIYCVVDLHAITVWQDPAQLAAQTREMAAALIACGLDPERCILFVQSQVPTHAQLGVSLSTVSAPLAQRYGLAVDTGAYVAGVAEGSGAAAAGIVPGDIVTAFDGQAVESASDLMLDVRTKNPGDTVTLTVNSGGKEKEVQVTLGDDSASQKAKQEQQSQEQSMNGYSLEDLFGGRQR